MNPFSYPDFIARFYDVIYDKIRSEADMKFYLGQMQQANGPVLEAGCGTGRLFMEARKLGVDVYGIDISPSMVEVLHGKLEPEERKRVRVADLIRLDLGEYYSLIIAPFRVFSHIITPGDQLSALESVYRHLKPGGTFIFDLYVPDHRMLAEGIQRYNDFTGEYAPGKKIRRFVQMHADPIRQVSHVNMEIIWDGDHGEQREDWWFEMRYYFRYELEHLIQRSPLRLEKILGDFSGNELNALSREFILICKKDEHE